MDLKVWWINENSLYYTSGNMLYSLHIMYSSVQSSVYNVEYV